MKNVSVAIILAFCLLSSSCASIFTKANRTFSVNSDPDGAQLTIVNKKGEEVFSGKTPATITLNASSGYMSGEHLTLTFSKPGYEEQKIYISSKIEGWYWGNILFGGLIGMLIIDPLTGAMYKFDPEQVYITLKKENKPNEVALQVIDINSLSDAQRENLVRLN